MIGIVVILLIVGVVAKKKGLIGKEEGLSVEISPVTKRTLVEKVSASGKIQPETEVNISPDVSGEIIMLSIKEGDSVQKGQLLLRIRPDNYISLVDQMRAAVNSQKASLSQSRSQLEQSKAELARSKQEYDRNKKLHDQKVISDSEFETISTNYNVKQEQVRATEQSVAASNFSVKSSEARLREANDNLSKTEIYAPVSGTVSKLLVERGERVVGTTQMAGTEMLRIANLNDMEVKVDVNENDIVRVSLGDTAEIEVDSYSSQGEKFMGVVTAIANSANSAAGGMDAVTEFEVKVRILNESYKHLVTQPGVSPFRPGMTASVDIITERKVNIPTVPLASVTTRTRKELETGRKRASSTEASEDADEKEGRSPDKNRPEQKEEILEVVFVKDGEKAKLREVKTGISDFEYIEIKSGLEEGTEVVSGPFYAVSKKLKDGDEITAEDKSDKRKGDKGED